MRILSRFKVVLDRTRSVTRLKAWARGALGLPLYERISKVLFPKPVEVKEIGGKPILPATEAFDALAAAIREARPFACGKIGASELRGLLEARRLSRHPSSSCSPAVLEEMLTGPGVFPPNRETLCRWAPVFEGAVKSLDLLAAWHNHGEHEYIAGLRLSGGITELPLLDPLARIPNPWFAALEGKRVLVVTPFVGTVEDQHPRRGDVWRGEPGFAVPFEIRLLGTPFSAGIQAPVDADWFSALERLEHELAQRQFDVAIVGAGAFSLPLCVAAKRLGKVGIHLGGYTQVLWGIRGKRFDDYPAVMKYVNEAWVRPRADEIPGGSRKVESGCYW